MKEQIVHFLKEADGYLSGEEISRTLNISRAAIWKNINDLRRQGYDIVAVPHLGYRLLSVPDKLLPWEIQYGLKTKVLGRTIVYQETVPSTMDEAFRLGMNNAEEGAVICAESQAKGRGRLGRSWVSPKSKGIYMSVILKPPLSPADAARLTLLCAVAVCEVMREYGVKAKIKWPNDILVEGRKLAGILTELNAEVDRVKFVVTGIGINVNATASQIPDEGTSLKILLGTTCSRVEIVQRVLQSLEQWYTVLKAKGFAPILSRWKELSLTLGQNIRITDAGGTVEGKAVGLDKDGGLLIRNAAGEIIKRISGDVIPAH